MKTINSILILLVLQLYSCKKTKLDGDLSVLVGTWEWRYTIMTSDICAYLPSPVITHKPEVDGFTCRLEILKKGRLEIFINDKNDKTYRLVKTDFADTTSDTTFFFLLNNKKKSSIYFTYKKKSNKEYLESAYFPEDILDGFDGCQTEYSIFEKVE